MVLSCKLKRLAHVCVDDVDSGVLFDRFGTFRYGMSYHGLMALQTGFLVAFTQLIPEHLVQLFGVIKIRVKVKNDINLWHTFCSTIIVNTRTFNSESTHALRRPVQRNVPPRLPVSISAHSDGMVGFVVLPTVHQVE